MNDSCLWDYVFLEIEQPSISEGIERCLEKGANEIVILLNFLNSGKHVDEDIPRIIREAKLKNPNARFYLSSPVGQHPKIKELFMDLFKSLKEVA